MNLESVLEETTNIIMLELKDLKPMSPEQIKLFKAQPLLRSHPDLDFDSLLYNDIYIVSTDINESESLIKAFGEGTADILIKMLSFNTLFFAIDYTKMDILKKIFHEKTEDRKN